MADLPGQERTEKRRHRRYPAHGDIRGRVVLLADIDVLDVSLGGIRFGCNERVLPRARIQVLIQKSGCSMTLECAVVRSFLKSGGRLQEGHRQYYEVAARFQNINDANRPALLKLLHLVSMD